MKSGIKRSVGIGALLFLGFLPGIGCSDSDDDPVVLPGITAAFTSSSTAAVTHGVRLRGGPASGDTVTVDVSITGPSDQDYYAFSFDLLLSDPTVAEYVGGSETFGPALTLAGGQGQAVLVAQNGDRIVIGVSKTGGGANSGNAIGASEEVIVSMVFRVLRVGMTEITIIGSPTNPQNPTSDPAALRSDGSVIGSAIFDSAAAVISGS